MSLFINTNTDSIRARNAMNVHTRNIATKMERLSSGERINGAKDDAAGLSISTRMEAQHRGYDQAIRNTTDGMSLLQTAEGALNETNNILQRMRELSVQAATETYNSNDLKALQAEVGQLMNEVSRIAKTTSFNGLHLFQQMRTKFKIQSGDKSGQTVDLKMSSIRPDALARQAKVTSKTGVASDMSLLGGFAGAPGPESFTLNGVDIRDSVAGDDLVSTIYNEGSAIAKSVAINAYQSFTGVSAEVGMTRTDNQQGRNDELGFDIFGNTNAIQGVELTSNTFISINDVKLAGFTIEDNDASGSLVKSINAIHEETGVLAHLNSSNELVLVAEDGRNVQLIYSGDNSGRDLEASIGLLDGFEGAFVYGGTVTLQSDEAIDAHFGFLVDSYLGQMVDNPNPFAFGGQSAVFGVNKESALEGIDLSTTEGAVAAIRTIDLALGEINALRSDIGANHNRLEHTVSNLQQTSENTKISKSRINDTEFASETAEMTREMMVASANVSVLAQANQAPSIALQLLGSIGSGSVSIAGGGPSSIF
jgi:flagellin